VAQAESRAEQVVGDVERDMDRVEQRRWFRGLARAGLGARAVLYFVVTYLTADIAVQGRSPAPADTTGALNEVSRQPTGPAILFIIAVGLMGYALWRGVSAIAAADLHEHARTKRFGLAVNGLVYLGLCGQAVALAVGSRAAKSSSSNPGPIAATVLRWPGGSVYMGICAAGFIAGGLALLLWGWAHDYSHVLDRSRMSTRLYGIARAAGIIGDTIRGLLIGLIGAYLMASAVTDNPDKVKGIDQALQALAHKPLAVWLLSVAAIGLFSFGLSSVFEARYRRL
jgi:hypothetical protein